ncbi:MAG: VCBS repeat-containing protein [Deltaproteobacteria bacterium]|nr:VCBS repeat-containing protein [Deltaproteobacteria bacterium]
MRQRLVPSLLLVVAGCDACDEETTLALSILLDGATPVRAEVVPAVGEGCRVDVPVVLLNAWSAAVPGGLLGLAVTGPTAVAEATTVEPDAFGHAVLGVTTDAEEAFQVEIVDAPSGVTSQEAVYCWTTAGPLPFLQLGMGWDPGVGLPPEHLGTATGGVLVASGAAVWWISSRPGAPAQRVLEPEDPIVRLDTLHVDTDGVLDALVRTRTEVFLLRGRRDGGMGWGAGFGVVGRSIHGAGVGDVDGDGLADVLLVVDGSKGDWLDVWSGDGTWGFQHLDGQPLPFTATDAWAADGSGDGRVELNALTEMAVLQRYARVSGGWAETWPSGLESDLATPAMLVGSGDLQGGGMQDLVLMAAPEEGVEQEVLLFVMEDGPIRYRFSFEDPFPTIGDLDGDRMVDLVVGAGDRLVSFTWEEAADTGGEGAGFRRHVVSDVEGSGPLVVLDADEDATSDVLVAHDAWRLYPGDPQANPWQALEGEWSTWDLALLAVPEPVSLEGEQAGLGLLGWADHDGTSGLALWRVIPATEGGPDFVQSGRVLVEDGALPRDLAVCHDRVYGLTTTGTLVAARFDGDTGLVEIARDVSKGAARLACGRLEGGAALAVAAWDGATALLDESLAPVDATELGSLGDLAAADTDGDGTHELVPCATQGCAVLAVDRDQDGLDEVYRLEDGLFVDLASGASEAGDGDPTAVDLDGDGRLEIVAGSPGRMEVHRPVTGGLAPRVDRYTRTDLPGPVRFLDWSGDGNADLVALGDLGSLVLLAREPSP